MDIYLKQEKFHRVIFKLYRVKRIIKKDQTIRNFLCYYQELASEDYPNEAELNRILGEYYDAKYRVYLTTYGSYSVIEYSLTAIDPKYLDDKKYNIKALEELFWKLVKPKLLKNTCDKELFLKAKETFESDLLEREEQPQLAAFKGAISTYFKGTKRDFSTFGSIKELKDITPKDLYDYLKNVEKEESFSIASGNFELTGSNAGTLQPKRNYNFTERKAAPKKFIQPAKTNQSYLEIFYELGIYANDRLYYAAMILNHIFGGQASSTLFKTVREKYGLCYSINSVYLGATGIIAVSAIINKKDLNKTLKAIKEAIKEIEDGNFNLKEAKEYCISKYYSGLDYLSTAVGNYLSDNYFLDSPKSTEELKSLKKVTKDDVLEVLKKLKQNFVYVYGGDGNE